MIFIFQNALTHFETSFVFAPEENHFCPFIIVYLDYLNSMKEYFIYVFPDSPFQFGLSFGYHARLVPPFFRLRLKPI